MKYNEAKQLGNHVEGVVKCTFAALYGTPAAKRPLFSIQRSDIDAPVHEYKIYDERMAQMADLNISVDLYEYAKDKVTAKYGTEIMYDAAYTVAVADGEPVGQMVPVKLTDAAISVIDRAMASKGIDGARYAELYERITTGEPLYVKECALDWYPVENKGDLLPAIEEYEKSKRLLQMGGLLSFIMLFFKK